MKFLPATIVALSIATITALATGTTSNDPLASMRSLDNAAVPDKPAQLMLAGGRRKCQENLGYGRTGRLRLRVADDVLSDKQAQSRAARRQLELRSGPEVL